MIGILVENCHQYANKQNNISLCIIYTSYNTPHTATYVNIPLNYQFSSEKLVCRLVFIRSHQFNTHSIIHTFALEKWRERYRKAYNHGKQLCLLFFCVFRCSHTLPPCRVFSLVLLAELRLVLLFKNPCFFTFLFSFYKNLSKHLVMKRSSIA